MKRTRADGALPPCKAATDQALAAKAPRRQKATAAPRSAAAERARARAAGNTARKVNGGDENSLSRAAAAAAAGAGDLMQLSYLPSASAEEEAGMGWTAAELGEWWWCLSGVEEEKLSGWFPFVDEDFFWSDSRGGEAASGGLLWEEGDHDIWQLQHIHEIPQTASK